MTPAKSNRQYIIDMIKEIHVNELYEDAIHKIYSKNYTTLEDISNVQYLNF